MNEWTFDFHSAMFVERGGGNKKRTRKVKMPFGIVFVSESNVHFGARFDDDTDILCLIWNPSKSPLGNYLNDHVSTQQCCVYYGLKVERRKRDG